MTPLLRLISGFLGSQGRQAIAADLHVEACRALQDHAVPAQKAELPHKVHGPQLAGQEVSEPVMVSPSRLLAAHRSLLPFQQRAGRLAQRPLVVQSLGQRGRQT